MYSTIQSIQTILERDLKRLVTELNAYRAEENIWLLHGQINNSAGNLALHLSGTVNHFIGSVLGNTGYKRDRPAEFSDKDVPREELINKIHSAMDTIRSVLSTIDDAALLNPFAERIGGQEVSTGLFLIHLVGHTNYHLGQVNYHRRMIERDVTGL